MAPVKSAKIVWVMAIALSAGAVLMSLDFLLVGPPSPYPDAGPAPQALFPLVFALLSCGGLVFRNARVALLGVVLLVTFSVLFLFSIGTWYWPLVSPLALAVVGLVKWGALKTTHRTPVRPGDSA
jgi:hypothetical protein